MKIGQDELNKMFEIAGVNKDHLYESLRTMGPKNLHSKIMREKWTPENPTYCYCYRIAEYIWYWKAPDGSTPYSLKVPGDPGLHRFIKWPNGFIIDLAVEQFNNYEDVNYNKAKVRYFMESGGPGPSIITRVLANHMGETKNWRKPTKLVQLFT